MALRTLPKDLTGTGPGPQTQQDRVNLLGPHCQAQKQDVARRISCFGLMLPLILWRHHCQYQCGTADSNSRCGWANPGKLEKREKPRAEEMHVVIAAKDFNCCTSPAPASTTMPLYPTLWLWELSEYERNLPKCNGSGCQPTHSSQTNHASPLLLFVRTEAIYKKSTKLWLQALPIPG